MQDIGEICRNKRKCAGIAENSAGIAENVAGITKTFAGQDQWSAGLSHIVDEHRENV